MSALKLIPLLDIRSEYGFAREVDSSVVLGGFLAQFWPSPHLEEKKKNNAIFRGKYRRGKRSYLYK
ncbi:MAG: hypothetical protein GY795_49795 [Desulfobacterales bacterium]|nr:hypothetical protein [Desulfobacterales bacterium]